MNDCLEISVAAVAALTRMSEHRAFALLESIADVHLVQADVFGSYLYGPLVKLFAKRRALTDDGPQMCKATHEVLSGLRP